MKKVICDKCLKDCTGDYHYGQTVMGLDLCQDCYKGSLKLETKIENYERKVVKEWLKTPKKRKR